MDRFRIRPIVDEDRTWVAFVLSENWGSTLIITRGKSHQADRLPGLIALSNDKPVGLMTYNIENAEMEIISLNSLTEGKGIGSALIEAGRIEAISSHCSRIWLITTNDNLYALRFYQKRGFHIKAIYPGALEESRKLKQEMPLLGIDEIPLRDEIELEMIF